MRHRIGIAGCLGIGRSIGTDFNLDNNLGDLSKKQEKLLQKISDNYANLFAGMYLDVNGCDFGWLNENTLTVGVEASYQYDRVLIFEFDLSNKDNCLIVSGTAFGPYGSDIAFKPTKYYKDYKRKSKYIKFIDTWYDQIEKNFKESI